MVCPCYYLKAVEPLVERGQALRGGQKDPRNQLKTSFGQYHKVYGKREKMDIQTGGGGTGAASLSP